MKPALVATNRTEPDAACEGAGAPISIKAATAAAAHFNRAVMVDMAISRCGGHLENHHRKRRFHTSPAPEYRPLWDITPRRGEGRGHRTRTAARTRHAPRSSAAPGAGSA